MISVRTKVKDMKKIRMTLLSFDASFLLAKRLCAQGFPDRGKHFQLSRFSNAAAVEHKFA
jgi:hypothetical protein